jgi:hypothetical protein
LSNFRDLLTL